MPKNSHERKEWLAKNPPSMDKNSREYKEWFANLLANLPQAMHKDSDKYKEWDEARVNGIENARQERLVLGLPFGNKVHNNPALRAVIFGAGYDPRLLALLFSCGCIQAGYTGKIWVDTSTTVVDPSDANAIHYSDSPPSPFTYGCKNPPALGS
jgi:hypothetical protein